MMRAFILMLVSALTACSGGDRASCDSASLRAELAAASAGETVRADACHYEGTFTIPAGVALVGAGRGATIILAPPDGPALVLEPGAQATVVTDLEVESTGSAGVVTRGEGAASLERVTLQVTRGIGIGAEGLTSLALNEVTLFGPVTPANAGDLIPPVMPADTATHGLVIVDVAAASLADVHAAGFAQFGALLVDSASVWSGGGVSDGLGTGLMAYGGSLDLEGVELCRMLEGVQLIPSYGGVFAGAAVITSSNLLVCDGEGYGLLHDDVAATHVDLVARGNALAGIWAQHVGAFELSGAGSLLQANGYAGLVAMESSGLTVRDARIEGSLEKSTLVTDPFGVTQTIRVGDGIHLIRSVDAIRLEGLALVDNERVGLLVDVGAGSTAGITVSGVTVDGSGTMLGAVAQGTTIDPTWDDGITRAGATSTNDSAYTGGDLDTLGVVVINDEGLPVAVIEQGLGGVGL